MRKTKIKKYGGAEILGCLFTGNHRCLGILVFLCLLLLPQAVQAAIYYVAQNHPGASDSNPGTETLPWLTIGKANSELRAGDTVYIREGTYNETIRPSRSGTAGNHITYARYNNENVIVTGIYYGANLDDKDYIIIAGLTIQDVGRPVRMNSTNHSIIQNCTLRNWTTWSGIGMYGTSSYNKILNNYLFRGEDTTTQGDIINLGSFSADDSCQYNLIEGNVMTSGYNVHAGIGIEGRYCSYNIVRNNTGYNIRRLMDTYSNRNLYENNIAYNMGHNPMFYPEAMANDFQHGSKYNIFRRNVLFEHNNVGRNAEHVVGLGVDGSSYAGIAKDARYNKVYHNTIWNHSGEGVGSSRYTPGQLDDNIYKNNILYNNGIDTPYWNHAQQINYDFNVGELPTDIWDGNLIMKDSAGRDVVHIFSLQTGHLMYTLSGAKTKLPAIFLPNNIEADPQFVDAPNHDFHLQEGSPCIDAGVFLTHTTGAGSGTTISVEDAGYFCDGWTIVEGDLIQLEGQTQTARITNVDYDNNILTLDRPLSWTNGQGVSLAYTGLAPDIGAYEYSGSAILYGDVSGDGEISAYDAALTAQYAVDLITLTPDQIRAAEVSGDSEATAYDAALIAQKAVGLIDKFPVE